MAEVGLYAPVLEKGMTPDGRCYCKGVVTAEQVDLDQQIVDAGWARQALREWYERAGNIREMHSPYSAVGKAVELRESPDGIEITAKVVDPDAVQKVLEGVYTGFSVGIRNPVIVPDPVARRGRIKGGLIAEVSLVDAPALPSARIKEVLWKEVLPDMAKRGKEPEHGVPVGEEKAGIEVKEGEPKSPPKGYPEEADTRHYADPANYSWPIDTPERTRSAMAYYNAGKGKDKYDADEWRIIGERIARAAERHFGGKYELRDGLVVNVEAAEKALALKAAGDPSALIRWYNEGADGQIPWGEEGDFYACVAVARDHVDDPEAFCAQRHYEATGMWPAEHAAMERAERGFADPVRWAFRIDTPEALEKSVQSYNDGTGRAAYSDQEWRDLGLRLALAVGAAKGLEVEVVDGKIFVPPPDARKAGFDAPPARPHGFEERPETDGRAANPNGHRDPGPTVSEEARFEPVEAPEHHHGTGPWQTLKELQAEAAKNGLSASLLPIARRAVYELLLQELQEDGGTGSEYESLKALLEAYLRLCEFGETEQAEAVEMAVKQADGEPKPTARRYYSRVDKEHVIAALRAAHDALAALHPEICPGDRDEGVKPMEEMEEVEKGLASELEQARQRIEELQKRVEELERAPAVAMPARFAARSSEAGSTRSEMDGILARIAASSDPAERRGLLQILREKAREGRDG